MIGTEHPTAGRVSFTPTAMTDADAYKLLSCAVQPRPIAWVSTVSDDGVRNLAPFSFFTVASRKPLSVVISIGERDGIPGQVKDTLHNIRATGEFVVNIPAADQIAEVVRSSAPVEPHVDEFTLAELRELESGTVSAPSVRGALFTLECRLSQEVTVGSDVLVVGEVARVTCERGLLDDRFHIDTPTAGFLGRLAGPFFSTEFNCVPTPVTDGS